jgi:hypothetical protein
LHAAQETRTATQNRRFGIANKGRDLETYDRLDDDAAKRDLLLHIRQDVQLIALLMGFLLSGILVMLGVIADRIN